MGYQNQLGNAGGLVDKEFTGVFTTSVTGQRAKPLMNRSSEKADAIRGVWLSNANQKVQNDQIYKMGIFQVNTTY